ncbi:MAG: hypothetical protein K6T75_04890 [Acetobacteraceae bacterium]|nr:hypothetical protein [Acetobacteraceae bacterium]
MRLTLNGCTRSLDVDAPTLGSLRRRLWRWAAERGEAVCELKVDGVSRLWEGDGEDEALGPHAQVEAVTRGVKEVAAEALGEAERYLPGLIAGLGRVAEQVGSGHIRQGMDLFRACLEGLEWVCGLFRLMVPLVGGDGGGLESEVEGSVATLEEVAAALRQGDLVNFTDLVNYRLLPALSAWQRRLPALAAALERSQRRASGEGGGGLCGGHSGTAT